MQSKRETGLKSASCNYTIGILFSGPRDAKPRDDEGEKRDERRAKEIEK
jgi:hypothetical protein